MMYRSLIARALIFVVILVAFLPVGIGHASSIETPIAPPASVFILPASHVGGRVQVYRSPTPPPGWLGDAQYSTAGGVGYEVRTFSTAAEASSINATMEPSAATYQRRAIRRPAEPGEWERLSHGGYVRRGWDAHLVVVQAGLSYRNILILLTVSATGAPTASATMRIEAAVAARVLDLAGRLRDRARTFALSQRDPSVTGPAFFPSGEALTLPAYVVGGPSQVSQFGADPRSPEPHVAVAYTLSMPVETGGQNVGVSVSEYASSDAARRGSPGLERYAAAGAPAARPTHLLITSEWFIPAHRVVVDKTPFMEGYLGFTYHNIDVYTVVVAAHPSTALAARRMAARVTRTLERVTSMYVQRLQMIEPTSPRTPPALTLVRPRPAPVPPLKVAVSVSPNPTSDGTPTSVDATTAPGASCVVSVRYASGYTAKSYSLRAAAPADASGSVSWTWTPATKYPGAATATVTCAKGSQRVTGVGSFTVE